MSRSNFLPRRCLAALAGLFIVAAASAAERVPLDSVAAVATSVDSSCALTSVGGVACWGHNHFGQLGTGDEISSTLARPVVGLGGVATQIAVGHDFACALLDDGVVRCWGAAWTYQLGSDRFRDGRVPGDVPNLPPDVVGITAGGVHACAWTQSGALYCWGQNSAGQLGRGMVSERQPAGVPTFASGVTHASAGNQHTCAVRNGRPWCFGGNGLGQVDSVAGPDLVATPVEVPAPAGTVQRVAAGSSHACALYADHAVRCWGSNLSGQLGSGDRTATPFRQVVGIAGTADAIEAGAVHTCARMIDGAMRCWGGNAYGSLGNENVAEATSAMPVPGLAGVTSIAGGAFITCAAAGGMAYCWGDSFYGATGHGLRGFQAEPAPVEHGLGALRGLSATDGGACVLAVDGRVRCWGHNAGGALASGNFDTARAPVAARVPTGIVALSRGFMTCGVTGAGALHCAGALPTAGAFANTRYVSQMEAIPALTQGVASVATRHSHACVVTTAGTVKCWGPNYDGQLGDGTNTFRQTPVAPLGLPAGIEEVRVGGSTSCARSATTLHCWGSNSGGQIGNGSADSEWAVPQSVALPAAPRALGLSGGHACMLDALGDVYCWGINGNGQLGDGTGTNRSVPVKVLGLTTPVVKIALGNSHTCALQNDGRLACWGANYHGELGLPRTIASHTLFAVTATLAPPNLVEIAAGSEFTCARDSDDRVWCWGSDFDGELGDGGDSPQAIGPVLRLNPQHIHAGDFERLPAGREASYDS